MSRYFDDYGKFEVTVNLDCIEKYMNDLSKLPTKTRNKLIRSAVRDGNRMLLASEKQELKDYAKSEGVRNKYKRIHTGQLKKGIKGRIKTTNNRISLIVGVRNTNKTKRTSYIKAPTYAGIWLNFGTRDHTISKGSRLRGKKYQHGTSVRGIAGNDWVMKSYNKVERNLMKKVAEDLENTYNDSVKSNYNSRGK